MDPDATYERWRRAARTGNDQAAADAHSDLMEWLNRGGFEPRWTEKQRAGFMAYGNENPTRSNFTSDAEHLRNTAIVVGGATLIGLIGYLIGVAPRIPLPRARTRVRRWVLAALRRRSVPRLRRRPVTRPRW